MVCMVEEKIFVKKIKNRLVTIRTLRMILLHSLLNAFIGSSKEAL